MGAVTELDPRDLERASIRDFVRRSSEYLTRKVLDFGAGKQPYRSLVPGDYHAFDRTGFPATVATEDAGTDDHPLRQDWDAILCTQVIQYVPHPDELLYSFYDALSAFAGHLVLTGPTNWPEVEPEDLHRHTRAGIRALLEEAGFEILVCESRAIAGPPNFELSLGYGIVAQVR